MKRASFFPLLFIITTGLSCSEIVTPEEARIVVYVHWQETPVQRKIEILETGESLETNDEGLAEFKIKPGNYTVCAYGINRGGPCCAYIDEHVTVKANETRKLEFIDCLLCV